MDLSKKYKLETLFSVPNAASLLTEEDSACITKQVISTYDADEESRKEWLERMKDAIKLALQIKEKKTEPWIGASNVKFPLLTEAALQFQSRAYPALVTSPDLVKCRIMGLDPDGQKTERAQRVADFMSYQLLEEDENWDEDTDRLFLQLPIVGCMFRKTYYDSATGRNCSTLILPDDFVASYYTTTLSQAPQYTVLLHPTENEIESKIASEEWLDIELPPATEQMDTLKAESLENRGFQPPPGTKQNEKESRKVLEQYLRLDMDGDGYSEPYICTVDCTSKKMLRLVPNFTPMEVRRTNQSQIDDIKNQMMTILSMPPVGDTATAQQADKLEKKSYVQAMMAQLKALESQGDIIYIPSIEYITKYSFIPSPDGGFYDIGFGQLLAPINDAVDTIINQLIDLGTLNNSNPGFIASNGRIRGQDMQFRPFELKRVEVPAGMLKDAIMPLEVNQPSPTMFNLLSLLIKEAQQLASVTEVMTGQLPGQNTKAGVAQQALDQGMKVFSGIVKRLYRSFTQEYRKLYRLNGLYLDPKNYFQTMGLPPDYEIFKQDFLGNSKSILPEADPNLGSDAQRMQQAMMLAQRAATVPGYNAQAVEKRILTILRVPNVQEIYPGTPPPPNPEIALKAAEQQRKTRESHDKLIIETSKAMAQIKAAEVAMWKDLAIIKAQGDESAANKIELQLRHYELLEQSIQGMHDRAIAQMELEQNQQQLDQQGQAQAQQGQAA